jgi:hypothetical protein
MMKDVSWYEIILLVENGEGKIEELISNLLISTSKQKLSTLFQNLSRLTEKRTKCTNIAEKELLGMICIDLLNFILILMSSKREEIVKKEEMISITITLQSSIKIAPFSAVVLMLTSASNLISNPSSVKYVCFDRFVSSYIQTVAQCTSKCLSDRSSNSEIITNLCNHLEVAVSLDFLASIGGLLAPDKLLSLQVYLLEATWSFILRNTELYGFDSITSLSERTIKFQENYLKLSCAKGIETVSNLVRFLCLAVERFLILHSV